MIEKNLSFKNSNYNCERRVVVVDQSQQSKRLDVVLSDLYDELSRTRIKSWISSGSVTLDGLTSKPSIHVKLGQILEINPPNLNDCNDWEPENLDLDIIYEDASILVLNKQSGLVVHPGAGNPNGTLLNGLIYHYPALKKLPRAGLVHRLDKDTSGLIVIAKTLESHKSLIDQLLLRSVRREYLAVTWGKLSSSMLIDKPIARNRFNRQKFEVSKSIHAKQSQTKVEPIIYGKIDQNHISVIKCSLKTGRTHQIRVHLEHIGFPIVGDMTYRKSAHNSEKLKIKRQALHARCLSFDHPSTKENVEFTIEIPCDILEVISLAGAK